MKHGNSFLGEGVYLTSVRVEGYTSEFYGMLSIGKKPTLGDFAPVYEVHIFDFDADIYGKGIRVGFVDFLRPQVKFNGIPDLINAMRGDEERCRRMVKELRMENE